ncbi:MAG TPA: radical SAM protein, partial [Phycisphaerales bacterium]|nr:radical SAM protein [Phycisphaerales bacterium]
FRAGWSREKAIERYRRLFRTGATHGIGVRADPVVRTESEESPEGEVLKFTQRIAANPVDGSRWGVGASGGSAERLAAFGTLETESVLIPMIGRTGRSAHTLCVSSQVGCAMGCVFCETAQMGLIRSLTPDEIVGQWFAATHVLGRRPRNIVFMGMGEPLDNFDNVLRAISVLKDHNGAAVPISKITVSTVGRLDGLGRLREKLGEPGWHRLNLAVSVNAADEALRSSIMPVNRSMPLSRLREALVDWPVYGGGKLCLEYVLIPGVNDTMADVHRVAEFVGPIDAHYRRSRGAATPRCMLNVIPYNPRRDSPWPAPTEESVDGFLGALTALGVYAKRRRTKGRRLMGACGQLGNEAIRGRSSVGVTVSASTRPAP